MIEKTTFDIVLNIWKNHLWTERKSEIDSHSAMLINGGYELKNFDFPATFFVYKENDIIMGCNSGHMCYDKSYRSRGLFVFPDYRKKGIGYKLLEATVLQGLKERADLIWSYPKLESWPTYNKAGFELLSNWVESETGTNAYCVHKTVKLVWKSNL